MDELDMEWEGYDDTQTFFHGRPQIGRGYSADDPGDIEFDMEYEFGDGMCDCDEYFEGM